MGALIATVAKRPGWLILAAIVVAGCAGDGLKRVESQNYNSRVRVIVIHHTTSDFAGAMESLTLPSENPVSSHYLIPEPLDPTYPARRLEIFELVPETERAWHAGDSYWGGRIALNDQSIGIELVNRTYCHRTPPDESGERESLCFFPDFAERQIELLAELLGDILSRHPDIEPIDIVGHSDIAPSRKIDPGPRFPWQRLYKLGFGAWYDDATVIRYWERFREAPPDLIDVQRALRAYGYGVEPTGIDDEQTRDVLRAFQMHFRPSEVTQTATPVTVAILYALIEKYRPEALDDVLPHDSPAVSDPPVGGR